MFSGTAPIVQTALVLSSPYIAADSSSQPQSLHPMLSPYYLRHDGRLRPAYYMMLISVISFLALTFGVPYCERVRASKEETRYTEAAIDHAFEIDLIPDVLEKSMLVPDNDDITEVSHSTNDRRTFSV